MTYGFSICSLAFQLPKPKVFLNLFQDRDDSEGVQNDIVCSG